MESANKLVVEARLKGAGRHWERAHVNRMLVLRNAVCNQRWQEVWQASVIQRQTMRSQQRTERADRRLTKAYERLLMALMRLRPLAAVPLSSRPPRYSWRQPFLRLPPVSADIPAKN